MTCSVLELNLLDGVANQNKYIYFTKVRINNKDRYPESAVCACMGACVCGDEERKRKGRGEVLSGGTRRGQRDRGVAVIFYGAHRAQVQIIRLLDDHAQAQPKKESRAHIQYRCTSITYRGHPSIRKTWHFNLFRNSNTLTLFFFNRNIHWSLPSHPQSAE